MLNRVHPTHGIALSDSKNFDKLSDWALEYRKEQGKEHYCPERVKAAAIRAQGYRTRNKRVPRNVFEQEQQREAIRLNPKQAAILDQQRKKAATLKAKEDQQKSRHKKDFRSKEDLLIEQERKDRQKLAEGIRKARNAKKNALRAKAEEQAEKHLTEKERLKDQQATMTGKVKASMEAVKSKGFMKEFRSSPVNALTGVFQLAFSKEKQQQQLSDTQKAEKRQFEVKLAKEQEAAAKQLRIETEAKKQTRLQNYQQERNDLLLKQKMEAAKMRAEWQQLQKERRVFLVKLPSPLQPDQKLPPVQEDFQRAAAPPPPPPPISGEGKGGNTSPPKPPLPPKEKTHEEIVAERLAAMKTRNAERGQSRDRGHGRER